MSIDYRFKPIVAWPGQPTRGRRPAPFRAGYARTLQDLDRELKHLGAREVVIQADCGEDDIRQDGRIRSSARMRGPGIILSFVSKHGPLSYPCDTYTEWTDNLRAIALALAALRAVDRYGVTKRAEQYRGWKQLPGGGDAIQVGEFASVEDAARFLMEQANWRVPVADILHNPRPAWMDACKRVPDKPGGDAALMSKVNRARDYIEKHNTRAA